MTDTTVKNNETTQKESDESTSKGDIKHIGYAGLIARRFFRQRSAVVGLIILLVLVFFALFGANIGKWAYDDPDLPAFYETWWAYLFYVLIVMGVSGYSLYLYLKRVDRKNNEMWADSKEMIKMRIYLDSKVNLPEPEFVQLDKLLLEKAVKAVEDNLTEPDFDVTALADAMNMSRSTLTRKLKAITGRTPLDFIRNIKMKHARHMLEDKDKSVTEVAATLGYFNRKYFTTCFKEEFGMTPSEFQKSQHEE